MKRLIAVAALIAGSVFIAVPAALADGDAPTDTPTTSDTSTPTDAPTDTPTDAPSDSSNTPAAPSKSSAPAKVKAAAAKEKVTICHATNSESHPYVKNRPAESGDVSGHAGHTGPIWMAGDKANGITWGDIIPEFDYPGGHFPGLNNTAAGLAILANGCAIPDEVVTPVSPEDPTVTAATCDADGDLTLPTTDHVIYSVDPDFDGPGDYTVNASPEPGYVLINDGDFPFPVTVDAQLTGGDCDEAVTPVNPDDPSSPGDDSNGVLPGTGGSPLWMLFLGAGLTAAGVMVLRRPQPTPGVQAHRLEF